MENELLKKIIQARMEAKSQLEMYRGLAEITGKSYQKEINKLLDKINLLNKLEEKLKK
jgi:hypothetical protein